MTATPGQQAVAQAMAPRPANALSINSLGRPAGQQMDPMQYWAAAPGLGDRGQQMYGIRSNFQPGYGYLSQWTPSAQQQQRGYITPTGQTGGMQGQGGQPTYGPGGQFRPASYGFYNPSQGPTMVNSGLKQGTPINGGMWTNNPYAEAGNPMGSGRAGFSHY